MPDGNYILGGRPVIKRTADVHARGALAGSAHTLSENPEVPWIPARAAGAGRGLGYGNPARMLSLPAGELRGREQGGYTALQPGYDGKAGVSCSPAESCFKMRRKSRALGVRTNNPDNNKYTQHKYGKGKHEHILCSLRGV